MNKHLFFTGLAFCLFLFGACQQAQENPSATAAPTPPAKPDLAKIKAEIQAEENAFAAAKDGAAVAEFYTADAITMPDDKPMLRGKAAIAQDANEYMAKRPAGATASFETLEVFGDEHLVTEIGKSTHKDAEGEVVFSGKYMAIWEKRNGKWLTIRDISNDDAKSQ